ncbi:pyridoxal phosphate-dependent transferase [Fimicolochytrium jonesii]|uniref:pyridoxal phosphate-dependent transferase n=1 Tax=Fimicolochytrium jonesii TaxID=1396493 RepID=UPI0022FEBBAA|nr:pyridoxal phosphate-dependent transferase [Fimicolochytrium jonesii]KAI8817334.1 pyridoxal phosphate-dependent transferase [Fimicolochytrium jonesii]
MYANEPLPLSAVDLQVAPDSRPSHTVKTFPLGAPIPSAPHAVSVSLPTWQANVGYEEGDPEIITKLRSGYPRFVYHASVKRLTAVCEAKFAKDGEACLVYLCRRAAEEFRRFFKHRYSFETKAGCSSDDENANGLTANLKEPPVRIAELTISPTTSADSVFSHDPRLTTIADTAPCVLHVAVFPGCETGRKVAKQFWQHSGEGISSRFAEHCLYVLEANQKSKGFAIAGYAQGLRGAGARHYRKDEYTPERQHHLVTVARQDAANNEHHLYVEERFGRSLDFRTAAEAKTIIKKRIAGVLGDAEELFQDGEPLTDGVHTSNGNVVDTPSVNLKESDVFLFPSGMSAIYNAHRLVLHLHPNRKSVQYGFPYLDTLKIQEKFGPGCIFLGHGDTADLDALEHSILPTTPISAVFCEFPSNPLLRTPDLTRLRRLANAHNFLIVVDETIGNFLNVSPILWADILVSSLTKIFSGDSDVMGGCAVISPITPHYETLVATMRCLYEDTMWCEDAVVLERNSRSFRKRIERINATAERLCDYLKGCEGVVEVHYPKFVDRELYERHARVVPGTTASSSTAADCPPPSPIKNYGYGGLFSLSLSTPALAIAFFDALQVAKGPSLGTNFTLACPYTLIAHYGELEWAESYGVPKHLVRVSVGLEEAEVLIGIFERALRESSICT